MHFLYNCGIRFYALIVYLASFFNPKAKAFISGRKTIFKDLENLKSKHVNWFHCASLGEFDQGIPVMQKLKEKDPDAFILVSFFSPSGYEHYHKRNHPADYVSYLPIDTQKNAIKWYDLIQPERVFFIKYEFWSNYILEGKKRDIKLFSISTILRKEQRFFKWYGGFFRKTLHAFDYFFVQNLETLNLLRSIGINQVEFVGDTRFDKVIQNKENSIKDDILENFLNGEKAFVIGSSWKMDEEILLPFINHIYTSKKIIIAPHNIHENNILRVQKLLSIETVRYTQYSTNIESQILILDCIGKLSNAYSYGDIAYVGGGFSGSLHNILEPTVFGLPVFFGPKHMRFPEANFFIERGIAFSVKNSSEILTKYSFVYDNLPAIAQKNMEVFLVSKGASEKIIHRVLKIYLDLTIFKLRFES
jgi:3-deoxy-D-manno-octulosonic-acid transferase